MCVTSNQKDKTMKVDKRDTVTKVPTTQYGWQEAKYEKHNLLVVASTDMRFSVMRKYGQTLK